MTRLSRGLTRLAAIWITSLVIVEFVIAEHSGFAAAITYVPQHLFAVPLLIAFLASLAARKVRQVLINGLFILIFTSVFLGFNAGLPHNQRGDLRVMTLNLAKDSVEEDQLLEIIKRENPDVIFLQEVKPSGGRSTIFKWPADNKLPGSKPWHVVRTADVAIVSRFPLTNVRKVVLLPGSGRRALIANMKVGQNDLTVVGVHFATNIPGARRANLRNYLRGSAKSRTTQVRNLIAALPVENVIIAGDFNLPPRGIAYRRLAARYSDTSKSGLGFGYTYRSGLPIARIDHIFASKNMKTISWHTVSKTSSDHRAVVTDISFCK